MKGLETKVEEYRKKQERLNILKKKMIDAEISWLTIKQQLNLTQYEYLKLKNGDLEERESEVLEIINKISNKIIKRNSGTKRFKKILIDKGIRVNEFCKEHSINYYKLFRTLRGVNVSRDYETEKQVESALGRKIFY